MMAVIDWFKKRKKKVVKDKAIQRLMELSRDMRRVKLDHYGNWESDPQFLKLHREFEELTNKIKEENGSR